MDKDKEKDLRKIKRIDKDGEIIEVIVEWRKLPCSKCERRYHFCCPKPDCWNKDGKYCIY